MQILQCKREQFRCQIRQQAHSQIFKQKRIIFGSQEKECSTYEQLLDYITNPRIITQEHLKELNSCLLNQIKQNLDQALVRDIEINIDNLLSLLLFQIANKKCLILDVLTIFINLTFLSDGIAEKLILNEYGGNQVLYILQSYILQGIERKTTLELLLNLWGNPSSHKKAQFEMVFSLKELCLQSFQFQDNTIVTLILKCFKNLVNSIRDEYSLFDFEFVLLIIKEILQYGVRETNSLISESMEVYCTIIQLFNFCFISQDFQLILQLLEISESLTQLIEQSCRICTYLYINEPDQFQKLLLDSVINFCKKVIRKSLNHQLPNVLNLCSILFHEQSSTHILQLQQFYDDQILIKEIIRLSEDCYPKKVREASIRCIKMLVENSNELQIQNLVELGIYFILIELTKDSNLDQQHLVFVLQSINNLLKAFSLQSFQLDYPLHLQKLALSHNNEIAIESNLILEQFEKEYHNICQ